MGRWMGTQTRHRDCRAGNRQDESGTSTEAHLANREGEASGAPRKAGSWLRLRCVFAMQMGKLPKPASSRAASWAAAVG